MILSKLLQIVSVLLLSIGFSAQAKERAEICAKYRTASGWSNSYKVEATIISGSELNQATSSFNYQSFDKYVIIFWDKDQASVIHMEKAFVTFVEQMGFDQQGRAWLIKKGNICF